jgi:hypothetical protein
VIFDSYLKIKGGRNLDWVKEAEKELKSQSSRLKATENIKIRLEALSKIPQTPETSEKQLLLYNQLDALYKLTDLCDRALTTLPPLEREILTEFYIRPHSDHVDYICSCHAIERSTVYRLKSSALKKFSDVMFGNC